jgi:hypothetical protein
VGPVTQGNTVQRVRVVFKLAWESALIDRPVCFGPGFKRPSVKALRTHRAKGAFKLFTAEEVKRPLAADGPAMRAMMLLGVNC